MDFWNIGNLTACCTCSRKADLADKKGSENDFYNQRGPSTAADKAQLGGVGIVFQGTENGGLKVPGVECSFFLCVHEFHPTLRSKRRQTLSHTYTHTHARSHADTRTHSQTPTHTHIHTHTHTGKLDHGERARCLERSGPRRRSADLRQWRIHRRHDRS